MKYENKDFYKVINGTSYHAETSDKVISILEHCRVNKLRIIVDYGDIETGKSWGETCDIAGYIGRSTGLNKIPLLIYNSRSMGGGGILDNCIIKITTSKGKAVLYQHPNYSK